MNRAWPAEKLVRPNELCAVVSCPGAGRISASVFVYFVWSFKNQISFLFLFFLSAHNEYQHMALFMKAELWQQAPHIFNKSSFTSWIVYNGNGCGAADWLNLEVKLDLYAGLWQFYGPLLLSSVVLRLEVVMVKALKGCWKLRVFICQRLSSFWLTSFLYCFSHESSRICFDEVKSYQMKVNYMLVIQLFIWESYFINPTHMCIYIYTHICRLYVCIIVPPKPYPAHCTTLICTHLLTHMQVITEFFLAICRLIVHWILQISDN